MCFLVYCSYSSSMTHTHYVKAKSINHQEFSLRSTILMHLETNYFVLQQPYYKYLNSLCHNRSICPSRKIRTGNAGAPRLQVKTATNCRLRCNEGDKLGWANISPNTDVKFNLSWTQKPYSKNPSYKFLSEVTLNVLVQNRSWLLTFTLLCR